MALIKKAHNHWIVQSKDGSKTLGVHSTKREALAQLAAVEISKKKRGK